MNLRDPEYVAGVSYNAAAGMVSDSCYDEIARHIIGICGDNQFKRAIWQKRKLDGGRKTVTLDKFHDYLFLPQRDGLGISSPALLDGILRGLKKDGPEALAIVMREIPNWEQLVRDSRPNAAEFAEQQGATGKRGGDRRSESATDQIDNVNLIKAGSGGNSKDYTLRRLLKESPALFDQVKSGKLSANAAAVQAGFRTRTFSISEDPAKAAQTIANNFSPEQLKEFMKCLRKLAKKPQESSSKDRS